MFPSKASYWGSFLPPGCKLPCEEVPRTMGISGSSSWRDRGPDPGDVKWAINPTLVGGFSPPLWKRWSRQLRDDDRNPLYFWENVKKWQPNHQPALMARDISVGKPWNKSWKTYECCFVPRIPAFVAWFTLVVSADSPDEISPKKKGLNLH